MANVFGEHRPKIPYQPVADLLAQYRQRDPDKLAIVDLDQETSISFGGLDRAVTDIAAALKRAGVGKGSRVLLLSDETLEKLLIWLAVWRLGAVVAPLNIELNATLIADLATAVSPVLTLVHKELDGDAIARGQAVRAFRRLHRRGRRRRSAGRFLSPDGARCGAGEPAGAQRCRRHRLHLLYVGNHQPAQDRRL